MYHQSCAPTLNPTPNPSTASPQPQLETLQNSDKGVDEQLNAQRRMAAQILAMRRQRKGVHAAKPKAKKAYVPPKVVDQVPKKGHFIAHQIGNKVRGGESERW
jgi:hypothetical protein